MIPQCVPIKTKAAGTDSAVVRMLDWDIQVELHGAVGNTCCQRVEGHVGLRR